MDLVSAEAEIRHVFGDTPITEASIGAAPPDILVKLSDREPILQIAAIKIASNMAARAFSRCNKAQWLRSVRTYHFYYLSRATTFNSANTKLVTLAPGLRPERRFAPLAQGLGNLNSRVFNIYKSNIF